MLENMTMGNKPLGIIGVIRFVGLTRLPLYESLYFASDKVIVARTATGARAGYGVGNAVTGYYSARAQEENMENLTAEEVLSSDANNFAIPYSQVESVELKKFLGAVKIEMTAKGEKYKWSVRAIPHKEKVSLADVEKILRPIFGEKFETPDEDI